MNTLSLNTVEDFFQEPKELTNSIKKKSRFSFFSANSNKKNVSKSMARILQGDRKEILQNQSLSKRNTGFFSSKKNASTRSYSDSSFALAGENSLGMEDFGISASSYYADYSKKETESKISFSNSFVKKLTILLCCVAMCSAFIPGLVTHVKYLIDFSNFSFAKDSSITGAMYGFVLPAENLQERSDVAISLDGVFIEPVKFTAYSIKSGDTVDAIVRRFGLKKYGTIFGCNSNIKAKKLIPGTVLQIPSMDGIVYSVKKGDTINSVAKVYGLSVENILDANDLDSEIITLGQKLFLPGIAMDRIELRKALGELFVYPLRGRLTSGYGYRANPFTGAKQFHGGIDLAAPKGTKIGCVLDGKVAKVGYNNTYGNYVIVVHDNTGYQSLYGHLSSVSVKQGANVEQGQKLGGVGSTGYSTGNHLHLSIYKNGCVINPFTVLDKNVL